MLLTNLFRSCSHIVGPCEQRVERVSAASPIFESTLKRVAHEKKPCWYAISEVHEPAERRSFPTEPARIG